MTFFAHTDEEEEVDEESASLDDELLAELTPVQDGEEEIDPLTEGFGEVPEEEEKAIEKASEKTDDDDEDAGLEEDAEDVDFDTFDDVDDM